MRDARFTSLDQLVALYDWQIPPTPTVHGPAMSGSIVVGRRGVGR